MRTADRSGFAHRGRCAQAPPGPPLFFRGGAILCAIACGAQLFLTGCQQECSTQKDCDRGSKCVISSASAKGTCVECEGREIPYDGIDNDCDDGSTDFDLDGDHDNWINAPVNPGTDCDDNNPRVAPALREQCGDSTDNDCDGQVDEIECMDRLPPVVTIVEPLRNQLITDSLRVRVEASDDVGIARVDLYADTVLLGTMMTPPYEFTVAPTQVTDGRITLRAEAIDGADRKTVAEVQVQLDIRTPPAIAVAKPIDGRSYDGTMTIDFLASDDGSGVDMVSADIDGTELLIPRRPPYTATIDTTLYGEGSHMLAIRAADRAGHVSNTTIRFNVDRTGPEITFLTPVAGEIIRGVTPVTIEAVDPGGIQSITFGRQVSMSSPLNAMVDASVLPVGPQNLTAVAVDATIVDDSEGRGHSSTHSIRIVADDGSLVPCMNTVPLPLGGTQIAGTTAGQGDDYDASCFNNGGSDVAYELTAPADLASFTVSAAGSSYPATLHLYRDYCGPSSELACENGEGPVTVNDVRAGDRIIVIVDGANAMAEGGYTLAVSGDIAPGQPCDPAAAALGCAFGTCTDDGVNGFACPGADCLDGIDNDRDGRLDENAADCTAPPALMCPPAQDILVLEQSTISAGAAGNVLQHRWEIVSAPLGSTIRPTPADRDTTMIHPLLAGPYILRYTALNDAYEFSSCDIPLNARTDDILRVELIWNLDVAEASDPTDVDLHLLHPDGTVWFGDPLDCYFGNASPSWGPGGADDDPRLDLDDVDGRGPENINIKAPESGEPYRIGVHYYADDGFGPSSVYINVFCDGVLEETFGPVTMSSRQIWRVADVTFNLNTCVIDELIDGNGLPLITNRGDPNGDIR